MESSLYSGTSCLIKKACAQWELPIRTWARALISVEHSSAWAGALKAADSIDTLKLADSLELRTLIHVYKQTVDCLSYSLVQKSKKNSKSPCCYWLSSLGLNSTIQNGELKRKACLKSDKKRTLSEQKEEGRNDINNFWFLKEETCFQRHCIG